MAQEKQSERKTAADVLIERFLKDVDEKGTMPWQRPYERYNSFNYFSKHIYRGFNRLMLPFGEYITKNQMNQYNKEHGFVEEKNGKIVGLKPEAYRFAKGIKWYPVVFFTNEDKKISEEDVKQTFKDFNPPPVQEGEIIHIGRSGYWTYYRIDGRYVKRRSILKYYDVADRKWFQNAKGECLPSRIETGELVINKQEPQAVYDNYIKKTGVAVDEDYAGTPCYIPGLDLIRLNPHTKSEESWFATAFHEMAHSTGAANRLNRQGVASSHASESIYAVEECIAEIAACLTCAETGVYEFRTSESELYDNNIAYVQAWKKRVIDWGKEFIYIVSQADKAFNYMCEGVDVLEDATNAE